MVFVTESDNPKILIQNKLNIPCGLVVTHYARKLQKNKGTSSALCIRISIVFNIYRVVYLMPKNNRLTDPTAA